MARIALRRRYKAALVCTKLTLPQKIGHKPAHRFPKGSSLSFEEAHSGGDDAKYLKTLEAYERQLTVKRQIRPSDLGKLAKKSLPTAPVMCQP